MLIKYTFVTGETTEVEVSDEIGAVVIKANKAEHAQEMQYTRHCYSLDAIEYEGMDYTDEETPESIYDRSELSESLYAGLQSLTEVQRRRLLMFAEGLSFREIAKREGVSDHKKIIKSIEGARKKMKKFL